MTCTLRFKTRQSLTYNCQALAPNPKPKKTKTKGLGLTLKYHGQVIYNDDVTPHLIWNRLRLLPRNEQKLEN